MPHDSVRIVKIRTKDLKPQTGIDFFFNHSDKSTSEQILKRNINVACQMLQAGKQAVVHANDSVNIILRCDDLNNVTVHVFDRSNNQIYQASIDRTGMNVNINEINKENLIFLKYIQKQLCPLWNQVLAASSSIQNGFVPGSTDYLGADLCPLNETFLKTNASALSCACDMFRTQLGNCCIKSMKNCGMNNCEQYTFTHVATALQLASLFAVGAQSKRKCIFNVNQLTTFEPSKELVDAIAECTAASEVSILSKCGDGNARRHNVYVKSATCDSLVGRLAQQECLGLNASMKSPIFIVNGVKDGSAAFIFHDENNRPLAHLNSCTKSFFFV